MPDPITPPAGSAEPKPAEGQTPATPPATPPAAPAAAPADKGGQPAARVVPEKYEIKLPDNSPLDNASIEKIAAFAKARGFTNEEAQALLTRESESIQAYVEGQHKMLGEKTTEWSKTWEGDKEIGGDAFKVNAELAKRVVDRFGSPDLKKALNDTGLGNHPELGRLLVRIGKAMSEDQLVLPGSQPGGKRPPEEVFYGETKN